LPSRTNPKWVAKFVELVYAGAMYEPDELVAFTTKPQDNPYRATFPRRLPDRYGPGNMVWPVAVVCGHNPYVAAKLVENLRAVPAENGTSTLHWDPIQPPEWAQRIIAERKGP
jgi:hypothetical protein